MRLTTRFENAIDGYPLSQLPSITMLSTHVTSNLSTCPNLCTGSFFLAADGQPGFDSLVVRKSAVGNILFLIENKFTESEKVLSRDEIWNKFDRLTIGEHRSILDVLLSKLNVRREHVVVVFAAMMELPSKFKKENAKASLLRPYKSKSPSVQSHRERGRAATELFAGEIVILDRDALRLFLGPTFGNYLSFVLKKISKTSSSLQVPFKKRKDF